MSVEEAKRQQALAEQARRSGIPERQQEMANSVDDALVRDLVSDFRLGPSPPSSMAAKPATSEPKKGTGWQAAAPLEQPPGIDLMDAMMDQQDKIDKAERVRKALELAAISRRAEKMK